jgi:serine/threonine protein kinase
MPAVGETVLHYRLESIIGQGGAGQVFQAYDTRLRRRVAFKILRADKVPAADSDPAFANAASRMLREARAVAALHHPNVVSIFDVGEIDGAPYIVMELAAGRTLRAYVSKSDTPIAQKVRWLREVADGLAAAHAISIIHRDVKPENVIVREDGKVQVLDFGIAKRLADEDATDLDGAPLSASTRLGYVLGTPRYMSPEQVTGAVLDTRTDQFSWGVMAYELLAGIHPWSAIASAHTRPAMPVIVTTIDARPLRELVPAVSDELASVIARAMSKDAAKRFPAMNDIVRALDRFAESASPGVSAPPPAGVAATVVDTTVDDRPVVPTITSTAPAPQPMVAPTVNVPPAPHALRPPMPTPAPPPPAPMAALVRVSHPGYTGYPPRPHTHSAHHSAFRAPAPAKGGGCGTTLVVLGLVGIVLTAGLGTCGYFLYEDVIAPASRVAKVVEKVSTANEIEASINGVMKGKGIAMTSVTCPVGAGTNAGDTFRCTGVDDSGQSVDFNVTMTGPKWTWELDGVIMDQLQTGHAIERSISRTADVRCPDRKVIRKIGQSFTCPVFDGGRPKNVVMTVLDKDGKVTFRVAS